MMQQMIAAILGLVMTLSLGTVRTQAIDKIGADILGEDFGRQYAVPDEVLYIINEDGLAETQEVFYLPEDGSLPDYITHIEYLDGTEGPAARKRPGTSGFWPVLKKLAIWIADAAAVQTDFPPDTADTDNAAPEPEPPRQADRICSQPVSASLPLGAEYSCPVNALGCTDIEISMSICGAVKAIDIYTPDGALYASLPYIAADDPYIIQKAEAGEWLIVITNYSADELMLLARDQGTDVTYDEILAFPDIELQISTAQLPSAVDVDAPWLTSDPYILAELFYEEGVAVTENGEIVDVNMPLADGTYDFKVFRELNGLRSEEMTYTITVDTTAPEITMIDLPASTGRDRCVLQAAFSEGAASVTINGEEMGLGCCGGSTDFVEVLMLEPGVNWFSMTVTDLAGHSTTQTFSVERVS